MATLTINNSVCTPITTTTTVCVRPEGIEGDWYAGTNLDYDPIEYFSSVEDTCTQWNAWKNYGSVKGTQTFFCEYETFTIGETVYKGFGTNCTLLEDGYYILRLYSEPSSTSDYLQSLTSITIITIVDGVITGIDTDCDAVTTTTTTIP